MICIIFIHSKPLSEHSCPVDEGGIIIEENAPIRREMFYHREKVIS